LPAKKKAAAAKSRKPSKVLTAAQEAKIKDAILADKAEVKELKAELKAAKAHLRSLKPAYNQATREVAKIERRVGVVLSKIETKEAKLG
jgi:chromosome segregation ATPase